ncbi:MotA/TolQ/ExbB proton channel family protein [candidate division KSB1 bacterium]|nr:MotA/TolQ/ExbB proton channel family protein [candidate division KSB1 bacterium]RQW02675.1 MAG: MotA/TolQ/ExbB proton channel family protein [candidate division KSB1 bacterium]
MAHIIRFFTQGGPVMFIILFALIIGIVVIIERIIAIRFKNRIDSDTFVNQIAQLLKAGQTNQAVEYCNRTNAALPNITKAGLMQVGKSDKDVQSALEIAAMVEIPRLEKRTHYLSMIANVATLLGLLGTILGLINAFAAVAHADAADKATLLTAGISIAMNTTAFGIITAIPCLIGYTYLVETTNELIDEINENVARLYRFMTGS